MRHYAEAMSLQDIKLPIIVLQNLYKNSLIDLSNDNELRAKITEKPGISFLGGNAHQIVLLVDNKDEAFLKDEQLSFLTGILNACKLSLADVALINVGKFPDIKYQDLNSFFNSRIVIMFGLLPSAIKLPFNIPDFQVQQFNHQQYLTIPPLNILEADKELKRKLWTSLKQLFSI